MPPASLPTSHAATGYQVLPCPPERLDEVCRLRASVWIRAGADAAAFPDGVWRTARDPRSQHWIALAGNVVVGCASFCVSPKLDDVHQFETYELYGIAGRGPFGEQAGLVIHEEHRGRGILRHLLDHQDEAARRAGCEIALRQASRALVPTLRRRGWHLHGPAIHDARFPNEEFSVMSLTLTPR